MSPSTRFRLVYAPSVRQHLAAIKAKYHSLIRQEIERQLFHEPDVVARNKKPLRQPAVFEASWEIRFGPDNRLRVLYDVDREQRLVSILAIGVKQGNALVIAGEEIPL